jgi:hypothetical protein
MRLSTLLASIGVSIIAVAYGFAFAGLFNSHHHAAQSQHAAETVYIRNEAPQYMSNATIERDIPAWEKAANADFAPVWDTPQVNIRLLDGPAPRNAIVATFQKSGSVQGALAYHTVTRGQPAIVVYTGVGDFYDYSNSVSFTHELFETLADAYVSSANMGTAPSYYIGQTPEPFPAGMLFVNEVSDPVEAYQYELNHVAISDFVTPNYFGDPVAGGLDYMNVLTHPFQIARGGYQIVWANDSWQEITNFRGYSHRDPRGFMVGEHR